MEQAPQAATPITVPERPGIAAFVRRYSGLPPIIVVTPIRAKSFIVDAIARGLQRIVAAGLQKEGGLDHDPTAWLSEVVNYTEDQQETSITVDTRPIMKTDACTTDHEIASAALATCRPRLIDGTHFDLEIAPFGDSDNIIVHMSAGNGAFHSILLRPGDDRRRIAEAAEAAFRKTSGASQLTKPEQEHEYILRISSILGGLHDITLGDRNHDPWRMLHGFAVFQSWWDGLPEDVRNGTIKLPGESGDFSAPHAPTSHSNLDLSTRRLLDTGIDVARDLLFRFFKPDLAAWAAEQTAAIAEVDGDAADAAGAWRFACIAAEACGDAEGIARCSKAALAALDRGEVSDADRARTLRSIVVSRLSALSYLDVLPVETWQREIVRLEPQVTALSVLLEQAAACHCFEDSMASFNTANDTLLRAQITALRGDLDGALALLRSVFDMPMKADRRITTLFFNDQLMLHLRRASLGLEGLEVALGALSVAQDFWNRMPSAGLPWRRARFHHLGAITCLSAGRVRQAAEHARSAWYDFGRILAERIRPLPPTAEAGCVDMMRLADLAQLALHLLAEEEPDTVLSADPDSPGEALPPRMLAADIASRSKSRQLRQTLGFSMADLSELFQKVPGPLQRVFERTQASIVRSSKDPRLILADLQTAASSARMKVDGIIERFLYPAGSSILDAKLPARTAVLDLFEGQSLTFMYLRINDDLIYRVLPVSADQLADAVSRMKSAINGNAYLPPINSTAPNARGKLLEPANGIINQLCEEILPEITDADMLVVAPHGSWFDLPVEASLSVAAHKAGLHLSVVSTPAIGVSSVMAGRRSERALHSLSNLVVCPAADDVNAEFFDAARKSLQEAMSELSVARRSSLAVVPSEEMTPTLFGAVLEVSGLVHVMAHGDDRTAHDPLRSGLLLSDGGRLRPLTEGANLWAGHIMVHPVKARHVTLQACSLGRLRSAPDGELWGLARALLSSGADTVIAPLWDIDIQSSTALLSSTYRHWAAGPSITLPQAFAAAQREMAERPADDPWSHIYHWGAFRLLGGVFQEPASTPTLPMSTTQGESQDDNT